MVSMVDRMADQNATYLARRRGIHYYYTRRIPKELQKRLGKNKTPLLIFLPSLINL